MTDISCCAAQAPFDFLPGLSNHFARFVDMWLRPRRCTLATAHLMWTICSYITHSNLLPGSWWHHVRHAAFAACPELQLLVYYTRENTSERSAPPMPQYLQCKLHHPSASVKLHPN